MKNKRICIIPARGGSTGLPGKNLKRINGETLVGLALRKAVACDLFDQVILSSDSDAILAEGKLPGVCCHRRSAATSTDTATSEAALAEVLEFFNVRSALMAMIQCTTPLLSQYDIAAAVDLADRQESCTAVSGYAVNLHHWLLSPDDSLTPIGESGELRKPRQNATNRVFVENGGIFVTKTEDFRNSGNRFNGRIIPYLMDELSSIDIDTYADLERVRELSAQRQSRTVNSLKRAA